MEVSVVVTVKNEEISIGSLLESLCQQSRSPDEVVICDGGSDDQTVAIIDSFNAQLPIKLASLPESNISQGRNHAIKQAAGPIIASTDAGVTLSRDWLKALVQPIEKGGYPVVSGWFEPHPYTDFEVVLGATVLPELRDIDPEKFLPSSRSVAYLKSAWEEAGGYPEWLDYGEDLVFDMALRGLYGPFFFVPEAVVYFRPRGDLPTFARQYYLYARGDGKANLWPRRHAIRYVSYLVGLPLILGLIGRGRLLGWAMLSLGAGTYCRRPSQRLMAQTSDWSTRNKVRGLLLIPVIRLVGDVAKMIGYPVGRYWRWRR